jgi:DNA mismatch repair protein MutS2
VREWLAAYTGCERGKSLALALAPLREEGEIERRLRALHEAKHLVEVRGAWPSPPPEDPGPWLVEARRGQRLDGPALAKIALLVDAVGRATRFWAGARAEAPTAAEPAERLVPMPELAAALRRAIDPAGEILDGASDDLARLRRGRRDVRQRVLDRLEKLAAHGGERAGAGDAEFVTQRDGRYVMSVRADRFDRSKGVVHDVSRSGAMLFVEPFGVLPLNNELRELAAAESEEVGRVLDSLSRAVAAGAEGLDAAADALAELDLLWARVRLSQAMAGTTPSVRGGEGGRLALRQARHPLLWRQAGGEADRERARAQVVGFDLELSRGARVLLVSGPNMGGKTVLLKAIGLAVAMAHAGLDVCAAEGAVVPLTERLLVDIGDAQSLEDHLSTFAARLVRMDVMARTAGPASFCLLDEIGAGTDPQEGAALARALLERLGELGAWTVATTHLGSLKTLAAERPEITNASMEIDGERLVPLFRLRVGIPGGSYALASARRLGLEPGVLARAEEAMPEEARALERLLARLGDELNRALAERADLAAERAAGAAEREEWQRRAAEGESERREREQRRLADLSVVEGQARALLREVRREAERAAEERDRDALREMAARARAVERSGDALRAAGAAEASGAALHEVEVGMEVRHAGLDLVARVAEGPDAEGNVVLARGTWRITCRIGDLRAPGAGESAPAAGVRRAASVAPSESGEVSGEVDVRGLAADEALTELDHALDRAMLAGLHELRIIHGVGRGVLREAVVRHLTAHPQVAGQRMGVHGEGGRGVTVAELA